MKECDILGGSKHTLTPPTYFQGVNIPQPQRSTLLTLTKHQNSYNIHCRLVMILQMWFSSDSYIVSGYDFAWYVRDSDEMTGVLN